MNTYHHPEQLDIFPNSALKIRVDHHDDIPIAIIELTATQALGLFRDIRLGEQLGVYLEGCAPSSSTDMKPIEIVSYGQEQRYGTIVVIIETNLAVGADQLKALIEPNIGSKLRSLAVSGPATVADNIGAAQDPHDLVTAGVGQTSGNGDLIG